MSTGFSTTTHSDGPYSAVAMDDGKGFWISSDNEIVARVDGFTDHPQIAANAALLAAAWDMAKALQGVIRVADRDTVEFRAARAALAKANGQQSEAHATPRPSSLDPGPISSMLERRFQSHRSTSQRLRLSGVLEWT